MLTKEQQAIADKWELEKQERSKALIALEKAVKERDAVAWQAALDWLGEITPSFCEHERPIWKNCWECEEIERELHPELFKDEEE
jgi:hypothetical protein